MILHTRSVIELWKPGRQVLILRPSRWENPTGAGKTFEPSLVMAPTGLAATLVPELMHHSFSTAQPWPSYALSQTPWELMRWWCVGEKYLCIFQTRNYTQILGTSRELRFTEVRNISDQRWTKSSWAFPVSWWGLDADLRGHRKESLHLDNNCVWIPATAQDGYFCFSYTVLTF